MIPKWKDNASPKLGAQRLYKAVSQGDVGATILYLTSENKGVYRYENVWAAWKEGTKNVQVLDALFYQEPDLVRWTHGRRRRDAETFDNKNFDFAGTVLRYADCGDSYIITSKRVTHIIDVVNVLKKLDQGEKNLNMSALARNLAYLLECHPKETAWVYEIAAESRGLGLKLLNHDQFKAKQYKTITNWFLNIHGYVVPSDFEVGSLSNLLNEAGYKKVEALMETETIRAFFAQSKYPYRPHVVNLRRQYQQFKSLLAVAPWLDTPLNLDKSNNDEDEE